jgi:hypothetical protein
VDARKSVTRNVTYLSPAAQRADYSVNTLDWHVNPDLEPREVAITDFRDGKNPPKLWSAGFELFNHRSAVTDFTSQAQLTQIYIPEVKALIGAITGAQKFFATPPVLRLSELSHRRDGASTGGRVPPVRFVHADYVRQDFHKFARLHIQEELGAECDPEPWLAGRYAAFNIWRVVSPPPHNCPLAFIDRRTIAPVDVIEGLAEDFGTVFYTWSARHLWGYFSDMTRDEAVVFLNFDSADDTLPGPPHSAFDDPTCPLEAPPRLSCEIHIYAYWGCP